MTDSNTANTATFISAVDGLKSSLSKQVEISKNLVVLTQRLNEVIGTMGDGDEKKRLEKLRDDYLSQIQALSANTSYTSGAAVSIIVSGTSGRR